MSQTQGSHRAVRGDRQQGGRHTPRQAYAGRPPAAGGAAAYPYTQRAYRAAQTQQWQQAQRAQQQVQPPPPAPQQQARQQERRARHARQPSAYAAPQAQQSRQPPRTYQEDADGRPGRDGDRYGEVYARMLRTYGGGEAGESGATTGGDERAGERRSRRGPARRGSRRARRAGDDRPEGLRRLLPQALVVVFLAGGTSAFVAHDKAVSLTVDGHAQDLHTFADDVGELLDEQGVHTGAHDLVAPSGRQPLADGDEVAVRHARPLTLTLDGRRRRVWTTAHTAGDALRQLGVRAEGAYVSVSRRARIGRTGLDMDVRTERGVVFLADGRERAVRTNAATVREALDQAGLTLGPLDATSVPLDGFPRDGQTVTVMRISGREKVREEHAPFATVRRPDPALPRGTEVVARPGRAGVKRVTYRLRTVNGVRQKPKRVADRMLRAPRPEIVNVGVGPLHGSVPGADGLDWGALARCESGGRPDAVDASGTGGGLYRLDAGTWHRLGGSGSPQQAPPAEQTYRAKRLYVTRGAGAWPLCGRKLAR